MPCKRYIEKFVTATLGAGAIRADLGSTLGCFVLVSLEKEIYKDRHVSDNFLYKKMDGSLSIQVNQYTWSAIGFEVAPSKQIVINRFLENYFKESLYMYCAARVNETERYRGYDTLIYEFAKRFNLVLDAGPGEAEDISFDGLKKMEYRYRTGLIEKASVQKIPQLFS